MVKIAALLLPFILVACAGPRAEVVAAPPPVIPVNPEFVGAPRWVTTGCNKGIDKKGVLCGVGSMKGTSNIGLARTAATARGRDEIARSIEVVAKSIYKDYQSSTAGGPVSSNGQQASSDGQHIENAIKQVTNQTLNGTYLDESWISVTGTYYALVLMDTEKFKEAVGQMKELSAGLRQAIIERSEKAFQELDRETAGKP